MRQDAVAETGSPRREPRSRIIINSIDSKEQFYGAETEKEEEKESNADDWPRGVKERLDSN
jgi:hypothetical protein